MSKSNSRINLTDKVEDGEMDLSMCDLQEVPVKDIVAYKKVYSLDLSNNHLVGLPNSFVTLQTITKLDLSKNKLKSLPENFGELVKLKHLDLYKNELQHLPLSFSSLKSLRWLDLKDNPLVPAIKDTAGQCLDGKQCQTCATDVVNFYTRLREKVDEEREVRERQRQKAAEETAAAAAVTTQKPKKKKKEKSKTDANEVEIIESEIKSHEMLKETKPIVTPSKTSFSTGRYFLISFLILIISFIVYFCLTFEETSEYIAELWERFIDRIPEKWVNHLSEFVESIGEHVDQWDMMF